MASNINPNNIDGSYPVAGQDNNSQGFRDNFTNIKQNFQYAEDEINDLQTKALLKAALTGTTLDNNMNDNLIYAAKIQDFSATRVQVTPTGSPLTATINYASGHYQLFSTTSSTTLAFTNFPTAGSYGYVRVQITITNVAHTITIPAAVSLGLAGIQGISPGTPSVSNTITFGATGTYEFAFSTSDGGATITLFDLNRALTNFTAADIQTDDITATGFVSAAGNVIGGNLRTAGFVSATGNVIGGNISSGGSLTVTANVVGGNISTSGTISGTGNITGVNLNGYVRPTAGGTTSTTAPIIFTAGSLVNFPTATLTAGSWEYDGTVFYGSSGTNQRGVIPTNLLRVQVNNNTLSDALTAQDVFSSPADISLLGSTTYLFEALYYITRSAGSNSHTLSTLFSATSALSSITYVAETTSTAGNALGTVSRIYGTAATALIVTAANTDTNENITVHLRGIIKTNAATTVTPQIQYSAAPGGAPTLLANSFIRFVPLGTSSVVSVGNWS